MPQQVFQEVATFHGTMKTLACKIVHSKYAEVLTDPDFEDGNQDGYYQTIGTQVKKVTQGGLFHKGGHDENVSSISTQPIHLIFISAGPNK